MKPHRRLWVFLAGAVGMVTFYLWGLAGLPGFGNYPGPYGDILNDIAVAQTHATAVVSAVNFEYRAFDTLGEEFILFAAAGVATVLRYLREERDTPAADEASGRRVVATSDAIQFVTIAFTGPTLVVGWYLASHAQTSPAGGFQGGVVLATGFALVYLAGKFIVFKRLSPVHLIDTVEAIGAGSFAVVGVAALGSGPLTWPTFYPSEIHQVR